MGFLLKPRWIPKRSSPGRTEGVLHGKVRFLERAEGLLHGQACFPGRTEGRLHGQHSSFVPPWESDFRHPNLVRNEVIFVLHLILRNSIFLIFEGSGLWVPILEPV